MNSADQLIAAVLCRAHHSAIALDEPDEARAILHLAQSFADELASAEPALRPHAVHQGRHRGSVMTEPGRSPCRGA